MRPGASFYFDFCLLFEGERVPLMLFNHIEMRVMEFEVK